MINLTSSLREELLSHGADLVGIGDLTELPSEQRYGLPVGVSIAVKYPKEVIRGIHDLPTKEYYEQYNIINEKLDALVTHGADFLKEHGYHAIALTREIVEQNETDYSTLLPHKTVATRARVGWIGKSALLVTEKYGSMIRLSSIVTDAPLKTAKPIVGSKCGGCKACARACPAGAIKCVRWRVGVSREELYDAVLCRTVARQRAMQGFGIEITQCGRCIEACPYTQRYLQEEDGDV